MANSVLKLNNKDPRHFALHSEKLTLISQFEWIVENARTFALNNEIVTSLAQYLELQYDLCDSQ